MWLVIDGNNLLNRILKIKEKDAEGFDKNYGLHKFLNSLEKYANEFVYTKRIIVWDGLHSQRRLTLFPAYKGNRKPKTDEEAREQEEYKKVFTEQKQYICSLLEYVPKTYILAPINWEADDVIAIIVKSIHSILENPDDRPTIISNDKDFLQLLDYANVSRPMVRSDVFVTDKTKEAIPSSPKNYPYYLAMIGDKSDGIDGIPGIGEATATEIIQLFEASGCTDYLAFVRTLGEHKNKRIRKIVSEESVLVRNIQLVSLRELAFSSDLQVSLTNFLMRRREGNKEVLSQMIRTKFSSSEQNRLMRMLV